MSLKPPPPALEPYLRLPSETSLITLTSTLRCSVNWLTTRFIASALSQTLEESENRTCIVLVSWIRDLPFFKSELRRTTGLDISKPPAAGRFAHIDAFSSLQSLTEISKILELAIGNFTKSDSSRKIILVLDQPDILLATGQTTANDLGQFLLTLRSKSEVHSTILTCPADLPLVSATTSEKGTTPLETATSAFLTTQAHASRFVLSCRELDTGAARDVSGVLRITKGGSCEDEERVEEAELLYLIQRDGGAKVFKRGSGEGVS